MRGTSGVGRYDRPVAFGPLGRREFLYVGLAGGLGMTLGDLLSLEAQGATGGRKPKDAPAKSLIHIYLPGGIAHQETFDPKPDAPLEYRGETEGIATNLAGVRFGEWMKQTAKIADKITVCRAMTHSEVDHGRGAHNMFTGYRPSPALVYPSMGSVVSHELGPRGDLPPYVCVPTLTSPFAGSGYLSPTFGPFSLGSDPARSTFRVRDLALPDGVDEPRSAHRRGLRDLVDEHFSTMEDGDSLDAMDSFYQRAYAMISSPQAREAFNLRAEPASIRDEYGRRGAGPRMLLARRLIEAGVRFVSLSFGQWDTHVYHFRSMAFQVPVLDRGFAALIRDLDRRGMLDSTLVMVSSEFGRTPKINAGAGRDHWPRVFSVVLAGGGIKKGLIHGASDAIAAEPATDALSVEDFATTVYHQLGISAEKQLLAPGNRPIDIVNNGKVIKALLA